MTLNMTVCSPAGRITRSLLGYGVIAGPLYVIVSLAQALTRPGFDVTRDAWSVLESGPMGWLQATNLMVCGLMVLAAALGLRRTLPPSRARDWGAGLLSLYGLGMVAAGIFRADGAHEPVSWHGTLHLVSGTVGFAGLIAAGFVLAGRFAGTSLARFSRLAALALLVGFASVFTGFALGLAAAVIVVSAWLSIVCIHLYRTAA
jgi:hypothetical membrane protein